MPDRDSDVAVAQSWWSALRTEVPPAVRGLWFGVFDAVSEGRTVRTMYVAGTPTFDADDETAEWATEYVWEPQGRYVVLPVLAALPDEPYDNVLRHAAEVIGALGPWPDGIGVAAGFDDGDFALVHSS